MVPFYPKIDYRTKGTLVLSSLLADLDVLLRIPIILRLKLDSKGKTGFQEAKRALGPPRKWLMDRTRLGQEHNCRHLAG